MENLQLHFSEAMAGAGSAAARGGKEWKNKLKHPRLQERQVGTRHIHQDFFCRKTGPSRRRDARTPQRTQHVAVRVGQTC